MSKKGSEKIESGFAKMGLDHAKRHAFLCVGPDCCSLAKGSEVWDVLKRECKTSAAPAMRSKAACLRLCHDGPWMVVYPEGVWYGQLTPERCRRIAQQHLVEGRVVEEWVSRTHPLLGAPPL